MSAWVGLGKARGSAPGPRRGLRPRTPISFKENGYSEGRALTAQTLIETGVSALPSEYPYLKSRGLGPYGPSGVPRGGAPWPCSTQASRS